ncbi:MAG: hypothetical protein ACRCXB_27870 [Aeromonadaceae bacterium]
MFFVLCLAAALIVLLAGILLLSIYRLYEAQEKASQLQSMVEELEERPSLEGLSDYSKRLVRDYSNSRRLHDGFRHKTSEREKTRIYHGEWE